jgi:hypothetical protein
MIGHKSLLGGVELGGTKCVCVIGSGPAIAASVTG